MQIREKLRKKLHRNCKASAGVDSQSVKTTEKGALEALMAGKKLKEENVIYLLTLSD